MKSEDKTNNRGIRTQAQVLAGGLLRVSTASVLNFRWFNRFCAREFEFSSEIPQVLELSVLDFRKALHWRRWNPSHAVELW
jgi:hypothetical protein